MLAFVIYYIMLGGVDPFHSTLFYESNIMSLYILHLFLVLSASCHIVTTIMLYRLCLSIAHRATKSVIHAHRSTCPAYIASINLIEKEKERMVENDPCIKCNLS
jgi:hypothetical protein